MASGKTGNDLLIGRDVRSDRQRIYKLASPELRRGDFKDFLMGRLRKMVRFEECDMTECPIVGENGAQQRLLQFDIAWRALRDVHHRAT